MRSHLIPARPCVMCVTIVIPERIEPAPFCSLIRPMVPSRPRTAGEARGNSRHCQYSLFRLSELSHVGERVATCRDVGGIGPCGSEFPRLRTWAALLAHVPRSPLSPLR